MLFLPASLLALAVLQVSAIPIDKTTCDPDRLSLILNPMWATSTTITSYCSALFSPGSAAKPDFPSLDISSNATPTDVRKACECVVAMPELLVPITQHDQELQLQRAQEEEASMSQKQAQSQRRLRLQAANENQEVTVRGGVVTGERRHPYGKGAVPVPMGSELKGFGARDNLYVRGGNIDGTRNRGT